MEIHTKGTQDVSQVKEPSYHPSYAADPWAVAHRGRGENFSCIGNCICLNLMIQGSLEYIRGHPNPMTDHHVPGAGNPTFLDKPA